MGPALRRPRGRGARAAQPLGEGRPLLGGHDAELQLPAVPADRAGDGLADVPLDARGRGAADDGEPHLDADDPVLALLDALDHALAILGADEADIAAGSISVTAPIAKSPMPSTSHSTREVAT